MKDRPTLVSLFAGAGGLDIGLEQAGFNCLAINELEHHACETLRQNKALSQLPRAKLDEWFSSQIQTQNCYLKSSGEEIQELRRRVLSTDAKRNPFLGNAAVVEGDIRKITTPQLLSAANVNSGELTLVAGGPPCQPFSRAGKRETVETEDGRLFFEFVRVVREARPRWFLFENVKGLAQSKTVVPYVHCAVCGKLSVTPFAERAKTLSSDTTHAPCSFCGAIDQDIEIKEVRGGSLEIILSEFRRIGYYCHSTILNAADFGVPQSRERLFIVGSRDNEEFRWPCPTHFNRDAKANSSSDAPTQLAIFADAESHSLRPWRTVQEVLWDSGHPRFGGLDMSRAVLWVKNVVRPHAEPVTWSLSRPSPTVGAHQGAKLAIAPEGVPDEQLARQQWHTKGRRQRDLPPVYVKHAMLSDEDLLRLQTFPPEWYLYGTRMERAFQIGNAVPPLLAMAVGKAILAACQKNKLSFALTPPCEEEPA